jgi:hypothetical protein
MRREELEHLIRGAAAIPLREVFAGFEAAD